MRWLSKTNSRRLVREVFDQNSTWDRNTELCYQHLRTIPCPARGWGHLLACTFPCLPPQKSHLWPPKDLGCHHPQVPSSHHLWHGFRLGLEFVKAAAPTTGIPTVWQPQAGWEHPRAKRSGCRMERLSAKVASDPHLAATQTARIPNQVTSWWLGQLAHEAERPRGPKQIAF